MTKRTVTLRIPSDIAYLPLALENAAMVAQMMGFAEHDQQKIRLGLEEAVANIFQHAFRPDEEAYFDMILASNPVSLTITLREQGLPFDPAAIPRYDPHDPDKVLSGSGLGLHLMRHCFDEVTLANRGKEGKETLLVKYLAKPLATEVSTADSQEVQPLPKAPPTPYIVRRMEPQEAIEVSRCAYFAYGYNYHEFIYFADLVREYNQTGKIISMVAVAENGVIMGHGALKIDDADPCMAEFSAAFVKPEYRGQGCLHAISQALLAEARQQGLVAVYANAVTTHPYSQKEAHKDGLKDCLILLSCFPATDFKAIGSGMQRESFLYILRYLQPPAPVTLYPPDHHRPIIEAIYDHPGTSFAFAAAGEPVLPDTLSSLKVTTSTGSTATIHVEAYGRDAVDKVHHILRNLCYERIETVYLSLPLCDPLTGVMTSSFEKLGFFFSGVYPGTGQNHKLMLQFLNNYRVNYEAIKIDGDFGNQLLAYIKEKDPAFIPSFCHETGAGPSRR